MYMETHSIRGKAQFVPFLVPGETEARPCMVVQGRSDSMPGTMTRVHMPSGRYYMAVVVARGHEYTLVQVDWFSYYIPLRESRQEEWPMTAN